jgi:hypothetical protein
MTLETLLSRLDKVKQTGRGRYLALCPAHADKNPSLSLRETDDGRILIKCWCGCETQNVLSAIGLTFNDLFPEPITHHAKPERRAFFASDLLRVIAFEALLTAAAACRLASGESLQETDRERLLIAAGRIREALHAGGITP